MRILVYGAGVLGCNLARDFFKAGKDVTLPVSYTHLDVYKRQVFAGYD